MDDRVRTQSAQWSQRVGAYTALPALIRSLGLDDGDALARVGLGPAALDDPHGRIAYRALGKLFHDVAARSGCDHVGLLAGRLCQLSDLGVVGELCRHSPTVGEALNALVFHQHLDNDGGAAFLVRRDGWVDIGYAVYCPDMAGVTHICDAVAAGAVNFIRELCGAAWRPTDVLLPHAPPASTTAHRTVFKVQPHFDADYCALRLPAEWLERRVEGAAPARLRAAAALVAGKGGAGVVQRVYRAIRVGLVTGECSGDNVARTLAMHRRTLNRRLEAEGTTFQTLLDEVRHETARQMLSGSRLSLDDIAAALGYGGVTQFMRRFRQWTGIAPGAWRRVQGQAPGASATSAPARSLPAASSA